MILPLALKKTPKLKPKNHKNFQEVKLKLKLKALKRKCFRVPQRLGMVWNGKHCALRDSLNCVSAAESYIREMV